MDYTALLVALLTGGAAKVLFDWLFTRGSTARNEWRTDFIALDQRYQAEIARLETRSRTEIERLEVHIRAQDERLQRLEVEATEWEGKFYAEMRSRQLLEVAMSAQEQIIGGLRKELEKWEYAAAQVVRDYAYRTGLTPAHPKDASKETPRNGNS